MGTDSAFARFFEARSLGRERGIESRFILGLADAEARGSVVGVNRGEEFGGDFFVGAVARERD